ncbi:MAG: peptidylprolyl isomerase [Planctomycetes bacterium]|nr:peptidylprolyl isomerase [Planctomycetota bacterium]
MNASSVLSLLLAAVTAAPQDPAEALARFQFDGRPAVVTRADVALEMAMHLRRRDRGKEACDMLVDAWLTRRAAQQAKVMPTREEVAAFWRELQAQLRAAGREPDDFAAVRNTSLEQWYEDLAVQMAQERLVRHTLGLGANEAVSPDMLKLWLQEERRKSKLVTDPDALPAGSCARIDGTDLPLADLGFLLLRTSEDAEVDRFVRQLVYLQAIERLGRREGVTLAEADLDRAIAQRRDEAARDPRYRGVPLEQLLQAEGLTVPALRQLRVFRGQVLLDKIALHRFPDADLLAEIQRDRQAALDLVGPRRRLGVIFVRALAEPNLLVPLDFPAAERKLNGVRERLQRDDFAHVAAVESEDGPTRAQGGEAGWHRRRSGELPEAVLAAAFALPAGGVSAPVRSEEGCWLVKVLDVDPTPSDQRLLENLRRYRAIELSQQVLHDADIQLLHRAGEAKR